MMPKTRYFSYTKPLANIMIKKLILLIIIPLVLSCSARKILIKTNNDNRVYISQCGEYIISGTDRNNIVTLRKINGEVIWTKKLDNKNELESAAISEKGKLIVIGGQGNKLYVTNLNGDDLWTKSYKKTELQVDINKDGTKIFVGN
jgi:outer membrane protein assembly factor BamB